MAAYQMYISRPARVAIRRLASVQLGGSGLQLFQHHPVVVWESVWVFTTRNLDVVNGPRPYTRNSFKTLCNCSLSQ